MSGFKNRECYFCHGYVLVNTKIESRRKTGDERVYFPGQEEDNYGRILNSRPFGMLKISASWHHRLLNQFFIDQRMKALILFFYTVI
jgi:hypothetical protein